MRAQPETRRIFLLAAAALVAAVSLVASLGQRPPAATDAPAADAGPEGLRVYRIATGTFALPPPDRAPFQYTAADAAARRDGSPLAVSLWVEQTEFETGGWRDQIQVGRLPIARPPQVDFPREVAVLVWPVRGVAPDSLMRANGLVAESLTLQHVSLELRVKPDTGGPVPATPIAPNGLVPYALFTIPRRQWPLPAPPPTAPPLTVTLAR